MRAVRKVERYPRLIKAFTDETELGEVINRSRSYVSSRMIGTSEFTHRDKKMILEYLHEPESRIKDFFPEASI